MSEILLASTSPRRRALLRAAGIPFRLVTPGPEGPPPAGASPAVRVLAHARSKARGAAVAGQTGLVLGVDTLVALEAECFGKPRDRAEAADFLSRLAGREHDVWTAHVFVPVDGGTLLDGAGDEELAHAVVRMRDPGPEGLERYLDGDDWRDKAGGYGIQSEAAAFIELVRGELDTVIGLTTSVVRATFDAYASP